MAQSVLVADGTIQPGFGYDPVVITRTRTNSPGSFTTTGGTPITPDVVRQQLTPEQINTQTSTDKIGAA